MGSGQTSKPLLFFLSVNLNSCLNSLRECVTVPEIFYAGLFNLMCEATGAIFPKTLALFREILAIFHLYV
jgi:hypothetical protein